MGEPRIKTLNMMAWIFLMVGIIMVVWRIVGNPTNFLDVIALVTLSLFSLVMQISTVYDNKVGGSE